MLNGVTFRSTLAALTWALSLSAHALADAPRTVDVPAGELTAALQKLASQSGVEFVYSAEQLKGVTTHGVHGDYTTEKAVIKLLEGTKLKLTIHASGALLISDIKTSGTSESAQESEAALASRATSEDEPKRGFWNRLRLAQASAATKTDAASSGETASSAASETGAIQKPQEITVTGTRLALPNLEAISPITTITREDLTRTGKARIEDIINQLPQAFAGQGSNIANGADGTATVNLRGLGENRTLVLVNGRRMMPGNPNGGSAADINQIPIALVKRVDVLTGGAAAVYGADAVAGVVNFIMDTEFEGLRIEGNYSFYDHSNDLNSAAAEAVRRRGFDLPESGVRNGYSKDFTFALGIGGPDDRGHASLYATYRDVDAVTQSQYDFAACTLNSGVTFACGGSSASNPGRFIAIDPGSGFPATADTIGAGNVLRPFVSRTDQYNFAPLNHFQRPDERYTAGAFVKYDVTEKTEAYGELMFMDDRSIAQIAPSGALGSSYNVNCDNPLLSPSMVQSWCTDFGLGPTDFTTLLVSRRNTEGGAREHDLGHESMRIVAGLRGTLGSAWKADAYAVHATTKGNSTLFKDFSISRTQRSLQVRDVGGVPTCISVIDGTDPNCVPWNVFQLGGVNTNALTYLQVPGSIRAEAEQQILHADFTGDLSGLVKLPTAESGLALNIGAEYRDEQTTYQPDGVLQAGDLAGAAQAFLPTIGGYKVKEAFFEARLPLVEGRPGIQMLSFETGYRYSDYDTGFKTDTYKAGLDWAPIKPLRIRGSYQHAARAPNVSELFSAQLVKGDGTVDPCEGILGNASVDDDPTASLQQCLRTGMTAAQYGNVPLNPISSYNGLIGGNPQVHSEEADTAAIGFVFQPEGINLIAAVDYFHIKVDGIITNGSEVGGNANLYLNSCIDSGEPFFCNLIHRDSFGSLWLQQSGYVVDTNLNLGSLTTSGIDVESHYTVDIGRHRLGLNIAGTYLQDLSTAPLPGGDAFDCVGFFGTTCGTPKQKWRHVFRADWKTPWKSLSLSASWRYFGGTDVDLSSTDSQLAGDVPPTDARLSSVSYFDLSAAIPLAERYNLRIGANNVLDETPPLVGFTNCPFATCNGNTFAQVYDTMGRQYFMTVMVEF